MNKYKQSITLTDGQTKQITEVSPLATRHVLQVDGAGTAQIKASINKETGLHHFEDLQDTLVAASFPGIEVWEITASGGDVTVTVCGE